MTGAWTFAVATFALCVCVAQPSIAASNWHNDNDENARSPLMRGVYWDMWMKAVRRRCPGDHLEWEGLSDSASDFVSTFVATLPASDQKKVRQVADDRCRTEIGGFTCYLSVYVDGLHRYGFLGRFAEWGCEHEWCSEDGLCQYFPNGRPVRRRS